MTATKKRARPAVRPEALQAAFSFGALDAIFTRRARRFALGATMTGPLDYRSEKEPVPLALSEEAILVAAATGITGVVREEWPFTTSAGETTSADKLASFTGRSFPSPLAIHGTELFWTNDEGVFVLPQRDHLPERYVQLQTQKERSALYSTAVKLQKGRLDVPRRRPNLFKFNEWVVNTEGSTLFIPVSDVTRQCITAMLLYFDRPHGYYIVDKRLGSDPLRQFVDSGLLSADHPVDLADFERWQMVDMNGVEEGLMVQNLMIATQALGIGGHPFSGGKGRVTFGGEAQWHEAGGDGPCGSLGFTFHRVPDDAPVGTSLRDYLDLDDRVFELKLTPNRGDCLSLKGLAREVAAITGAAMALPAIPKVEARLAAGQGAGWQPVALEGGDRCPIYLGRVIRLALPGRIVICGALPDMAELRGTRGRS